MKSIDAMGLWDTNFTGTWEMDHDPIKEFIMLQNDGENSRNRRHSESDAASKAILSDDSSADHHDDSSFDNLFKMPRSDVNEEQTLLIKNLLKKSTTTVENKISSVDTSKSGCNFPTSSYSLPYMEHQPPRTTDLNANGLLFGTAIRDEGYATPDTLTSSQSEVDSRRLYEREISTESLDNNEDDEVDLVRFKAKFNRNVEQIWNDAQQRDGEAEMHEMESEQCNISSFWQKYHKHRYDFKQPAIQVGNGLNMGPQQTFEVSGSTANDEGMFYKNSIWSNSCGGGTGEEQTSGVFYMEPKKIEEEMVSC